MNNKVNAAAVLGRARSGRAGASSLPWRPAKAAERATQLPRCGSLLPCHGGEPPRHASSTRAACTARRCRLAHLCSQRLEQLGARGVLGLLDPQRLIRPWGARPHDSNISSIRQCRAAPIAWQAVRCPSRRVGRPITQQRKQGRASGPVSACCRRITQRGPHRGAHDVAAAAAAGRHPAHAHKPRCTHLERGQSDGVAVAAAAAAGHAQHPTTPTSRHAPRTRPGGWRCCWRTAPPCSAAPRRPAAPRMAAAAAGPSARVCARAPPWTPKTWPARPRRRLLLLSLRPRAPCGCRRKQERGTGTQRGPGCGHSRVRRQAGRQGVAQPAGHLPALSPFQRAAGPVRLVGRDGPCLSRRPCAYHSAHLERRSNPLSLAACHDGCLAVSPLPLTHTPSAQPPRRRAPEKHRPSLRRRRLAWHQSISLRPSHPRPRCSASHQTPTWAAAPSRSSGAPHHLPPCCAQPPTQPPGRTAPVGSYIDPRRAATWPGTKMESASAPPTHATIHTASHHLGSNNEPLERGTSNDPPDAATWCCCCGGPARAMVRARPSLAALPPSPPAAPAVNGAMATDDTSTRPWHIAFRPRGGASPTQRSAAPCSRAAYPSDPLHTSWAQGLDPHQVAPRCRRGSGGAPPRRACPGRTSRCQAAPAPPAWPTWPSASPCWLPAGGAGVGNVLTQRGAAAALIFWPAMALAPRGDAIRHGSAMLTL